MSQKLKITKIRIVIENDKLSKIGGVQGLAEYIAQVTDSDVSEIVAEIDLDKPDEPSTLSENPSLQTPKFPGPITP